MPYLERIAIADQAARRAALLAILRELDCPFTLHREQRGEHRPENAVVQQAEYRSQIVDQLPPGDDWTFEDAGVPNIDVSVAPAQDVPVFLESVAAMRQRQQPRRTPAIMETMHNRSLDALAVIEESAMQQVFQWIAAVVQQLS